MNKNRPRKIFYWALPSGVIIKIYDLRWRAIVGAMVEYVKSGQYKTESKSFENVWACRKCDMEWSLEDGTPFENEIRYCPKCGRRVVAEIFGEEEDE